MRAILASVLLCATLAFADQPADRTAIESVVKSLKTASPVAALFTADADSDLVQLNAAQSSETADQIWSESAPPGLVIDSIRFLTPDVAIVNAAVLQIGSVLIRRTPVLFVMKKETNSWKIASLRMLSASPRF
jgi:hypothetical protein